MKMRIHTVDFEDSTSSQNADEMNDINNPNLYENADACKAPETTIAKVKQFIKFALFSIVAGVIQFGVCTILNIPLKIPYFASYIVGLVLSVLYNFTINRRFTFKSANNLPKAMGLVFCYYLVFTPLSALWGAVLTDGLFFGFEIMQGLGWNMFLVLVPTMIINMVTEFIFCRLVVFRNSMNTIEKK